MKLGKITVGTIWAPIKDAENVYIGRSSKHPSPLGNPYPILAHRTRDEACDQYEDYIMEKLNKGDSAIRMELNRIGSMLLKGKNVNLTCYCAPKRCHGEFIKQIIDEQILEYQAKQEK
jgi:hypothetical protein